MSKIKDYSVKIEIPGIAAGIVVAQACRVEPAGGALLEEVNRVIAKAQAVKDAPQTIARKAAVRDMLRYGSYKPTGRGKPASEYLFNAAIEGNFPLINNMVEINNLVSADYLLPISLVDIEKTISRNFIIRRGKEGENYVFNPAGQIIELKDLLLLSMLPDDVPCGTPIKDSQKTKTHVDTKEVIAVIYAPAAFAEAAKEAAEKMASLLELYCGAQAQATVMN